jgi:hypothetical protein
MGTKVKKDTRPPLAKETFSSSLRNILSLFTCCFVSVYYFERHYAGADAISQKLYSFALSLPHEVAYFSVSMYFVIVLYHIKWRSSESKQRAQEWARSSSTFKNVSICWNYGLTVLSMIMLSGVVISSYDTIKQYGLQKYICNGDVSWDASKYTASNTGVLWQTMFMLSKFPELVDTVLLMLKGKELMFLHWYHHITVLAFCWYAYSVRSSAGIYFAVVNYFIHSLMYFYYGMTQLSPTTRKMVKP